MESDIMTQATHRQQTAMQTNQCPVAADDAYEQLTAHFYDVWSMESPKVRS
jgi:hypothetical protein